MPDRIHRAAFMVHLHSLSGGEVMLEEEVAAADPLEHHPPPTISHETYGGEVPVSSLGPVGKVDPPVQRRAQGSEL